MVFKFKINLKKPRQHTVNGDLWAQLESNQPPTDYESVALTE